MDTIDLFSEVGPLQGSDLSPRLNKCKKNNCNTMNMLRNSTSNTDSASTLSTPQRSPAPIPSLIRSKLYKIHYSEKCPTPATNLTKRWAGPNYKGPDVRGPGNRLQQTYTICISYGIGSTHVIRLAYFMQSCFVDVICI